MLRILALIAALTLITPANAMEMVMAGPLKISGAYSFETPPNGKNAAGYLVIENTGTEDDVLTAAAAAVGGMIQLHKTEQDANGTARMIHQENGIPLPAGETVVLEPGGLHIMFMGLSEPFAKGETLEVTLTFQGAGEVQVMLPILARGEAPAHGTHSH